MKWKKTVTIILTLGVLFLTLAACSKNVSLSTSKSSYKPATNDYGYVTGKSTPDATIKLRDKSMAQDSWWAATKAKSDGTFKLRFYYSGDKKETGIITSTKRGYHKKTAHVTILPDSE